MMQEKEILIFVYGTLKMGGLLSPNLIGVPGYNSTASSAEFVGDAQILSKDFIMRDLGVYPALQIVDNNSGDHIHGELYLGNLDTLARLDKVEGYPNNYNRKLVDVWCGKEKLKAWVYYIEDKGVLSTYPVIVDGLWDATSREEETECVDFDDNSNCRSVDFEVDSSGVYISNEYGDYWGPYEDINAALYALDEIDTSNTNVLNIGFRMIREDITDVDMASIEQSTFPA